MGLVAAGMLLGSCSTPKNVVYFPDLEAGSVVETVKSLEIKVRPDDKLSIVVSTQDPALSSLFNLVSVQSRVGGATSSSITTTGTTSNGNGQVSYYNVDSQGNIEFPILGVIHVAGLTREQISQKIKDSLESADLVKDPIVTVEFANAAITVLGEVKRPGRIGFNEDHLTIIEAIGMAGDLGINGVRDNILVIRTLDNGTMESYRVSLLDAKALAASPVYYLQQNDVIYVEPNDKVVRETTPNGNTPYTPSFWISLGSFAITISTMIITLSK